MVPFFYYLYTVAISNSGDAMMAASKHDDAFPFCLYVWTREEVPSVTGDGSGNDAERRTRQKMTVWAVSLV